MFCSVIILVLTLFRVYHLRFIVFFFSCVYFILTFRVHEFCTTAHAHVLMTLLLLSRFSLSYLLLTTYLPPPTYLVLPTFHHSPRDWYPPHYNNFTSLSLLCIMMPGLFVRSGVKRFLFFSISLTYFLFFFSLFFLYFSYDDDFMMPNNRKVQTGYLYWMHVWATYPFLSSVSSPMIPIDIDLPRSLPVECWVLSADVFVRILVLRVWADEKSKGE